MSPFTRPALALLLSALLAACGQPIARPAPTAALGPTAAPTRRAASSEPVPTAAPSEAALRLTAPTPARWDWHSAAGFDLPAGTAYTYSGETEAGWCRLALAGGARPWVACSTIGVATGRGPGPDAPALAVPVEAPAAAAPPARILDLPSEDTLAQQQAQPGRAPRDLPADVAAEKACGGSPLCQGMTNADVEAAARAAEAGGDYTEAARLRQYLPEEN